VAAVVVILAIPRINRALGTVHHFHAVSVWTTEVFVQSPIEGTIPQANQTNFTQDIEQVRQ
jgi:hypothetical protein